MKCSCLLFSLMLWASVPDPVLANPAWGAARVAIAGAVGQVVNNAVDDRPILEGTLGAAIGGAVEGLVAQVLDVESGMEDPRMARALAEFRQALDERVTHSQLDAMWRDIDRRLTNYDAELFDLKRKQQLLSTDVEANRGLIEYYTRKQREMEDRFDAELGEIRVDLREIRSDIVGVRAEAEAERQLNLRINTNQTQRIEALEQVILPSSSGEIAAQLGAKGAELIINDGDSDEAANLLLLSMAYDGRAHAHPDPGARYYLAIAYKRMGFEVRAREMLMEGVFAERFRRPPEWFQHTSQWLQGEDRLWMRQARRDPRFGVKSPREVSTLVPYRIPIPSR